MANNYYYYLISGLPDITIEDSKKQLSLLEFRDELKNNILQEDFELIKLYFYKYDNQNVLDYLQKSGNARNESGIFTLNQIEEEYQRIKEEGVSEKSEFPLYLQQYIDERINESTQNSHISEENQLTRAYFEFAIKCKNSFVSKFFLFELNTLNFLTAALSRKYNLEYEKEILGDDDISLQIKKSTARDFNLGNDFEFTNALMQLVEITDIKERERRFDILRWNYLEDAVFFNYFTIERIFAYIIKLDIIERWTSLTKEQGKDSFDEMFISLRSGYKFPEEYLKK